MEKMDFGMFEFYFYVITTVNGFFFLKVRIYVHSSVQRYIFCAVRDGITFEVSYKRSM